MLKDTPEYGSWRGMIDRCTRPSHIGWKYYGARGITVCARWRKSFKQFLADMGPKPTPRHTIDRKNPNGSYTKHNCRWATPAQQRRNQRPYDEAARVQRSWDTGKRSRINHFRKDLTGQTFARLTVISYADTTDRRARWRCRCTCGTIAIVTGKSLRSGDTKSCGCLNREKARERAFGRNKQPNNPARQRWANR